MKTVTKILLAVSLTTLALGFTDVLWGLGKPVGAICFGLFMIFKLLENETELFDQEEQLRLAQAARAARKDSPNPIPEGKNTPFAVAIAHSHSSVSQG